jgi:hypothetical protein
MTAKAMDIPIDRPATLFPTDDIVHEKAIATKFQAQLLAANQERDTLLSYGKSSVQTRRTLKSCN